MTSRSRTPPAERASTQAACGKVTARSSGLAWNRSETFTRDWGTLGSRKLRRPSGVANTPGLCAWSRRNASSSTSSSSRSASAPPRRLSTPATSSRRTTSAAGFLAIGSASACWLSGVVGR